jgi:hypothetical protein
LSHRTRARTTGGDARKQPKPAGSSKGHEAEVVVSPETLARTLRAVAAELERDPELARRISDALAPSHSEESAVAPSPEAKASAFRPRLVTGTSPDLGPGIPDPFQLWTTRGEKGLCAALEELRLGSLRAIIREYNLVPQGKSTQHNDAAKLRALILESVARANA